MCGLQVWPLSSYVLAKEATRNDFLIPAPGLELPFAPKKLFRKKCSLGGCGLLADRVKCGHCTQCSVNTLSSAGASGTYTSVIVIG